MASAGPSSCKVTTIPCDFLTIFTHAWEKKQEGQLMFCIETLSAEIRKSTLTSVDLLPILDRSKDMLLQISASSRAWNSLLDLVLAPEKLELNPETEDVVTLWLQRCSMTETTVELFDQLCCKWPNAGFRYFETNFGFLSFKRAVYDWLCGECEDFDEVYVSSLCSNAASRLFFDKPKLFLQQLQAAIMHSQVPDLVFDCLTTLIQGNAGVYNDHYFMPELSDKYPLSSEDVSLLVSRVVNDFRHEPKLPWDDLRDFAHECASRCNMNVLRTLAAAACTCVLEPDDRPLQFGLSLIPQIGQRLQEFWPDRNLASFLVDAARATGADSRKISRAAEAALAATTPSEERARKRPRSAPRS